MEKTLWCQFQSEALRAPVEEIIAHGCVKRKIVFTTLKAGENPQKISALTAKKKMQQLYVALLLYKLFILENGSYCDKVFIHPFSAVFSVNHFVSIF
ncbi:hypothetical protein T4D_16213 [Trichinella pseudospiralis]|uniref:Uncharacterized protein n=1 Tax=Trichinella pseudospiralis TaxID=6337 RepID=A0A0V1F9K6_TRIPS|nr:hypothetical protein T4D_16213 [Trichinella pseudospiralis]